MTSALGAIAGGAATQLIGSVLGGGASNSGYNNAVNQLRSFTPTNFGSTGLSGATTDGTFNLTRSAGLDSALSGLSGSFGNLASRLNTLAGQVVPGYGDLTNTLVQTNENNRRRAIGNLRENLQRRRVLGSSFGQDSLARAEMEFNQNEQAIRAQAFLQELDAQAKLFSQAGQASAQQFSSLLTQFNFESELAANISNSITGAMNSNNQLMAQLLANQGQANAGIWGTIAGTGSSMLGIGLGSQLGIF